MQATATNVIMMFWISEKIQTPWEENHSPFATRQYDVNINLYSNNQKEYRHVVSIISKRAWRIRNETSRSLRKQAMP